MKKMGEEEYIALLKLEHTSLEALIEMDMKM